VAKTEEGRFHLGITAKLLIWCVTLIAIFYANTAFLFVKLREIVSVSNHIVVVNNDVDETAGLLIQQLLSVEEALKRFLILKKEAQLESFYIQLVKYGQILSAMRKRLPDVIEPWQGLKDAYEAQFTGDWEAAGPKLGEKDLDHWLEVLVKVREQNKREMRQRLLGLFDKGEAIMYVGLLGLSAAIAVGLVGSLFLAYRFSRPLRELKRGIRAFSREGQSEPIRILSHDELGDLTKTFNQLMERLMREEEMRTDFISMLSHEIRTPLTSIKETVSLLEDGTLGPVGERQSRFLAIASKELVRLSKLLERLMQVSSLQSRDIVLSLAPANPVDLVRGAVERMAAIANRKGLSIEVEVAWPGGTVALDTEHIRQVLLNLIGNALKFSPAGSVVRVGARPAKPGLAASGVVFWVADRGPGIPEDEQPFVFQKYYRGALAEKVDGAGLGLNISKRIVEAHGGEMRLLSRVGEGSIFSFHLPSTPEVG